jgi:hypothetical protein
MQFFNLGRAGILSLLVLLSITSFAQTRTITGKVTNKTDGQPLPGVSVQVKGQGTGTQTDAEGNYSISVPENATLIFTHTGFESQEVPVGTNTTVDVQLAISTSSNLNEVVVIGYGSVRKRDLTGIGGLGKGGATAGTSGSIAQRSHLGPHRGCAGNDQLGPSWWTNTNSRARLQLHQFFQQPVVRGGWCVPAYRQSNHEQ